MSQKVRNRRLLPTAFEKRSAHQVGKAAVRAGRHPSIPRFGGSKSSPPQSFGDLNGELHYIQMLIGWVVFSDVVMGL